MTVSTTALGDLPSPPLSPPSSTGAPCASSSSMCPRNDATRSWSCIELIGRTRALARRRCAPASLAAPASSSSAPPTSSSSAFAPTPLIDANRSSTRPSRVRKKSPSEDEGGGGGGSHAATSTAAASAAVSSLSAPVSLAAELARLPPEDEDDSAPCPWAAAIARPACQAASAPEQSWQMRRVPPLAACLRGAPRTCGGAARAAVMTPRQQAKGGFAQPAVTPLLPRASGWPSDGRLPIRQWYAPTQAGSSGGGSATLIAGALATSSAASNEVDSSWHALQTRTSHAARDGDDVPSGTNCPISSRRA